ncbi:MAG: chorismate mutase [Candidatus Thermoplasmatota archaeon]|jgi:chorismate mutase|nr:chorismate mutase [Candidatus Thermoplasmatota archaeon]
MTNHVISPVSLDRVRSEIESVDRSIVLLLAARLDAARRALSLRAPPERRVTDPGQERRVLSRAQAWARDLDLPVPLVEGLFRALIEEGKTRYKDRTRAAPEPGFVTVLVGAPEACSIALGDTENPEPLPVPGSR